MQHSQPFLALVKRAEKNIEQVDCDQVKVWLDNKADFLLLDVREDHEWQQGHLPTAQHLSKGIIERDIVGIVPEVNTKLVLYCSGGFRSVLAARSLQDMGYQQVISMSGGFKAWREADYPIVNEKV